MIQQIRRPCQRLVRGMALCCWVRQLPHGPDLKPTLSAFCVIQCALSAATPEAEQALGHGGA
jgi:hypothetical protein